MTLPRDRQQRLSDLALTWRDAQQTLDVCRRKLQAGVLTAMDDDAKPAEVARAIGVSPSRVYAIIVAASKDQAA